MSNELEVIPAPSFRWMLYERTNERTLFANEKTLAGYQYRHRPIKAGHQKQKKNVMQSNTIDIAMLRIENTYTHIYNVMQIQINTMSYKWHLALLEVKNYKLLTTTKVKQV